MPPPSFVFLPGLGFDRRIFGKLDLSGMDVTYLDWIDPLTGETIGDYALRLSAEIDFGKMPVLIGHSFGGIMAQEIAARRPVGRVILISSIRSKKENPWHLRALAPLGLHRVFNKKQVFSTFHFWAKKHSIDTLGKEALFKSMIGQHSDKYLRWALRQLSNWQGAREHTTPIFQIHGDADQTFPIRFLEKPDFVVKNGSHLMVLDRAGEIQVEIQIQIQNQGSNSEKIQTQCSNSNSKGL